MQTHAPAHILYEASAAKAWQPQNVRINQTNDHHLDVYFEMTNVYDSTNPIKIIYRFKKYLTAWIPNYPISAQINNIVYNLSSSSSKTAETINTMLLKNKRIAQLYLKDTTLYIQTTNGYQRKVTDVCSDTSMANAAIATVESIISHANKQAKGLF